jgi:hypothetical protein
LAFGCGVTSSAGSVMPTSIAATALSATGIVGVAPHWVALGNL